MVLDYARAKQTVRQVRPAAPSPDFDQALAPSAAC